MLLRNTLVAAVLLVPSLFFAAAQAEDWPMWRYDAARAAASPEELPATLQLQWTREFSPRTPVWDDPLNQDLMPYDSQFEPILVGDILIVGFNDTDKVVGLDAASGEERWAFFMDGPTRLPPAAWRDRVFIPSDDGRLYCLNVSDGSLRWAFQAAPKERLLLGNRRIISTWPLRGGPVVAGDTVYFAAGIWPFMGTFLYALDADSGAVRWLNDGNGPQWLTQPHGSASFAGVGPQGAMVVAGDALLVPGGRSVAACFERASGAFRYYEHASNNKTGGAFACAWNDVYFNHHREGVVALYETATGKNLGKNLGRLPVLTPASIYFSGETVSANDAAKLRKKPDAVKDSLQWTLEADATGDLIRAGSRLYAGGDKQITAIDAPDGAAEGHVAWQLPAPGKVKRLLAGHGRLFAVTAEGCLLAFGETAGADKTPPAKPHAPEIADKYKKEAAALLQKTGIQAGYALCYGVKNGELLEALARDSKLHLIAFEAKSERIAEWRKQFDAAGFQGEQLAVLPGNVTDISAPPYLASLTWIQDPKAAGFQAVERASLEAIFRGMRPYDGAALLQGLSAAERNALQKTIDEAGLGGLTMSISGEDVLLKREGALEGAASWTHMLADIGQSGKSDDDLVRLPLGLLWFGGSSNMDVLPRHGHGPPEQVIGGRLFIEGIDCFSARDVYTGRVLWKTDMPELGTYGVYFNETYKDTPTSTSYNQVHIPGANARGTNFVATADEVYLVEGTGVQVLDAVTGAKTRKIEIPAAADANAGNNWGYIGVYEDVLLGGAGYIKFSDMVPVPKKGKEAVFEDLDDSASKRLAAFDRHSGKVLWERAAAHAFLHNGIAVGGGLVFCLDKLPPHIAGQMKRRGLDTSGKFSLLALDVKSGEVRWQNDANVFGSFLCYSKERGLLVQSTRPSRDSLSGEDGKRMAAFQAADGAVLWDREMGYRTFPLLHGQNIVTEGMLFDIATGNPVTRTDPVTAAVIPWTWRRDHGCNYPIAAKHLLTFRSGAAGFCDISGSGGTGSFGGFRSSCTSNLVAADGILNAPDYTRTCSCAYQNQTSLAMIHDPDAEMWTYTDYQFEAVPLRQIGLNFGAPGDRLSDAGTLWLDYPSTGGQSPEVKVRTAPENPVWFRHHSSRYSGDALRWVAASGAEGISEVEISLGPASETARNYIVRLYFAEPDDLEVGQRVFNVSLQGEQKLEQFDIIKEAGAVRCALVKEFSSIPVTTALTISLQAVTTEKGPILCGVEAIAEGW